MPGVRSSAFPDFQLPTAHAQPGRRPPGKLRVVRHDDHGGAVGMDTVRIRDRYDDTSELPDADFVVDSHAALRELLAPAPE